jgi:WD40 repeat protein
MLRLTAFLVGMVPVLAAASQPAPPRLDAHGDPLPDGALLRIGTTRLRPGAVVTAMTFTPDGKKLVTATPSTGVQVWDVATGKSLHALANASRETVHIAIAADGSHVATCGDKGAVRVRQIATGADAALFGQPRSAFLHLQFSPDGKVLAVMTRLGEVEFREVVTGKLLSACPGAGRTPDRACMAFAPDGKSLAVAVSDGRIVRYDVATGKTIGVFGEEQDNRTCGAVAFSPDGKVLAAIGDNKRIDVWQAATGKRVGTIAVNFVAKDYLTFTRDSRYLFANDSDCHVCMWDVTTAACVRKFPAGDRHYALWSAAVSPDGKTLATADDVVRLWRIADGTEICAFGGPQGRLFQFGFAHGGNMVLTGHDILLTRLTVFQFWDAATGKLLRHIEQDFTQGRIWTVSADGNVLALMWNKGNVEVRDSRPQKVLMRQDQLGSGVWQIDLSHDGKSLVVVTEEIGGRGCVLHLWNVTTAKKVMETTTTDPGGLWGRFTGDGRKLLVWTDSIMLDQRAVTAYDTTTGRKLPRSTLVARSGLATLSTDGRLLAQADFNGHLVTLYEVVTGQKVGELKAKDWRLMGQAFSPDGRLLAVGTQEGDILLWDVVRGELLTTWKAHLGGAHYLAWSPDSTRLTSSGADTTIMVWNAEPWRSHAGRSDIKLTAAELEALWQDLASPDGARAWAAITKLVRCSGPAIAFLRQQLRPSTAKELARMLALIRDLNDEKFAVRQQAQAELEKVGDLAAPLLENVLAGKPTIEVRQRIEKLLRKLEAPPMPECLRQLRALHVLELNGTAEVRVLLRELAAGEPQAWLTREAQVVHQRLTGLR